MGLTITENKTELHDEKIFGCRRKHGSRTTEVDVYCRKLNDAKKTYAEEKDMQQNVVQESISVKYHAM